MLQEPSQIGVVIDPGRGRDQEFVLVFAQEGQHQVLQGRSEISLRQLPELPPHLLAVIRGGPVQELRVELLGFPAHLPEGRHRVDILDA